MTSSWGACAQARTAARQERAAKIISLTSLILLLLAVSMYATIVYFGFNPYIAAAALFCAGAAGYPLLAMLTYAVASQTSRSFKRLGPYDRCACPRKCSHAPV
jgi:Flp pilus assembly protein TadB